MRGIACGRSARNDLAKVCPCLGLDAELRAHAGRSSGGRKPVIHSEQIADHAQDVEYLNDGREQHQDNKHRKTDQHHRQHGLH